MAVFIQELRFIEIYAHSINGQQVVVYLFQTEEDQYLHVSGQLAIISSSSLPPF
jgi:hypothetical protein